MGSAEPRTVVIIGFTAGGRTGVPRYASMLLRAIDKVAVDFHRSSSAWSRLLGWLRTRLL